MRDLLALDIDPAKYLPSDDSTRGFDNVAAALSLSPALLEGYTSAAAQDQPHRARRCEGTGFAVTFRVPADTSQDYHIDGLPFGTRGGMIAKYQFPADGDYVFKIFPINKGHMDNNQPSAKSPARSSNCWSTASASKLYDWDKEVARGAAIHSGTADLHVQVKAGPHTIGVTFLATNSPLATTSISISCATPSKPADCPASGSTRTSARSTSRPLQSRQAQPIRPAARRFSSATPPTPARNRPARSRSYLRSPATRSAAPSPSQDTETLMGFYQLGRNQDGTSTRRRDGGAAHPGRSRIRLPQRNRAANREGRPEVPHQRSRTGLPPFVLPLEQHPGRRTDQPWPARTSCTKPAVLEKQVRRMLADPKSDALVNNFAGQWLNVRGLQTIEPLAADLSRLRRQPPRRDAQGDGACSSAASSTKISSVMDLLTANYTFVNERLAKHYGMPNIYGSEFRRVDLDPEFRHAPRAARQGR